MTPRKPKQRQQHHRPTHSGILQPSDYDSDAQNYNVVPVPPPTRTNNELNLSVIRRYNPAIRTILSIAANAVIYLFTPATQQWEKSGVEGTLFVCDLDSNTASGEAGFCIMVLNRRGLENLIVDLAQAQDVEVTPELLIMRFQEGEAEEQKVMGIWIHKDKDDTWESNVNLIQQCWGKVISSNGNGTFPVGNTEVPASNRRMNLTGLFGQQGAQ